MRPSDQRTNMLLEGRVKDKHACMWWTGIVPVEYDYLEMVQNSFGRWFCEVGDVWAELAR